MRSPSSPLAHGVAKRLAGRRVPTQPTHGARCQRESGPSRPGACHSYCSKHTCELSRFRSCLADPFLQGGQGPTHLNTSDYEPMSQVCEAADVDHATLLGAVWAIGDLLLHTAKAHPFATSDSAMRIEGRACPTTSKTLATALVHPLPSADHLALSGSTCSGNGPVLHRSSIVWPHDCHAMGERPRTILLRSRLPLYNDLVVGRG